MAKGKKNEGNELPYSLYSVSSSEENKHADTVFIHCNNGRTFATGYTGYSDPGELLLAEWDGENLGALYKVKEIKGNKVLTSGCVKGSGSAKEIPLSQITDHR